MIRWLEPSPVRWLGAVEPEAYAPTKTLADVVASVRPKFEQLVAHATSLGMKPAIRSAGRTCEEQHEQVALGYSHADLCRGMHVMGHAVDLDLSPSTCATYTKLGEWWEQQGGVWGGRWTQFGACGDSGHFQYGLGSPTAGAVPTSLCPSGVTLQQCKKIREDYLSKNLGGGGVSSDRGYNLLALGLFGIIGAVVAFNVLRT
jgi:hypothetical protein